ncbi:formate dehydrogenase accessory sulfurtransferase FdhD [Altererythrobacter arenosus]|uniref:Sulfur carrier protein FdhD n=1 Tax=Altererythrobacter arenosus TaxID=3032592 RepID=A0ABY8FQN3_9SPHN|nr:formate dehydrogenase accessory sulfurtransferase FdhD [Altererythrobacter sp. CAU 1644]WFL77322.1 formate dehydrogenase accessory sulfurtransferase FdhD [Altererythrobacter sp. CAU 1644]
MPGNTREVRRNGTSREVSREWVPEVPVALEFNGLAYAVMMATPRDLEDFVTGFALTEGLAARPEDIDQFDIAETDLGYVVRTQLSGLGIEQLSERVRTRVAESSCGLCGIENLEALAKPLPKVPKGERPAEAAIFAAVVDLRAKQVLNAQTGAAHAAAFANREGQIILMREDVGRHNAVDKLVGALAAVGRDFAEGFVLSTARCSYEIVEKVVRAGGNFLVTISLPTSMAVERARAAGLGLVCLARDDSFLEIDSAG